MIQKTINLYTLAELSKEAQKRAHSDYIATLDYPFLSEYMTEYLKELFETSSIKCDDPKIHYSLSYCQGDGAMFEGECLYNEKYKVVVKHSGYYHHERSTSIYVYDLDGEEVDEWQKVEKEFEEEYITICQNIASYGYGCIEEDDEFDRFVEHCEANDYTFTSEGVMEN